MHLRGVFRLNEWKASYLTCLIVLTISGIITANQIKFKNAHAIKKGNYGFKRKGINTTDNLYQERYLNLTSASFYNWTAIPLVEFRDNAPSFKGNVYFTEEISKLRDLTTEKQNVKQSYPVEYFSYFGRRYNLMNPLWNDRIHPLIPKQAEKVKYNWTNDKYRGRGNIGNIQENNFKEYLLNRGIELPLSKNNSYKWDPWEEMRNNLEQNKTIFFNEISYLPEKYDISKRTNQGTKASQKYIIVPRENEKEFRKLSVFTLSDSDPIDIIQEIDGFSPNSRWNQEVLSEIPSNIQREIVDFEYGEENEHEINELHGKEGRVLKNFVRIAVDFSFLSGSSLNAAVCMYKALLPLMKIRWKSLNMINVSRMDTIIKVILGIPFFRYFEDKESMINTCINMFFTVDMSSGEGLCLNEPGYEGSIMGISAADLSIGQYYKKKWEQNKEKKTSENSEEQKPHDSANLLEMIYDDVCNYFYECIDEDLSPELSEYIFQNSRIFDISENQNLSFFNANQTPLFPEISERKTSVNALPSDKFLSALQELSQINPNLPELAFPGMNIRDLGRLYYYSGRLGLQLPIRLALKMIYEISTFANHSTLLRETYCTETLTKITNFKSAEVLCSISFSHVPLKFDTSKLFINQKDVIKRVSSAPSSWTFRPDPICSDAEKEAEKNPEIISPPNFIQFSVVHDKWSLYRSLAIQLYGSIKVDNGDSVSSIVSMIHSLVLGYIKLQWDYFKIFYQKVGVLDPEKYYSLLVTQRRGPAIIELIAFSQIYDIPIKLYEKVIKNSSREILFVLDNETSNIIKLLGIPESSFETFGQFWKGNNGKKLPCKIIRLLINKQPATGFNKKVFARKELNLSIENTVGEFIDGSGWTWDALLPVYDTETNKIILSEGIGVKLDYKTISGEYIDLVSELLYSNTGNHTFPPLEPFGNTHRKKPIESDVTRKPSNYTYGNLLISKSQIHKFEDLNKLKRLPFEHKQAENSNLDRKTIANSNEINYLESYKYNIVIQPLISFFEVGVYESKVFMDKIFKYRPIFNWEDLPNRLDLAYLQSVIYVGDISNVKRQIEIDNWKPPEHKNNVINIFPENKVNSESEQENSEIVEQHSENKERVANENKSVFTFNENRKHSPSNKFNGTTILNDNLERLQIETKGITIPNIQSKIPHFHMSNKKYKALVSNTAGDMVEYVHVLVPTKKPWNNSVELPESGIFEEEPEFSFIPFKGGPLFPKKLRKASKFTLDMNTLFILAREFWMLPLDTSSRSLYCFGKNIAPYLKNPDPNYVPQMLIYDKIISTVISLLPVVDTKMSNLRPIQFIITVCEMALLDPIDLDPFLIISRMNIRNSERTDDEPPTELVRLFSQLPVVKNICSAVTSCIHSSSFGNEYKNLISHVSISETYNRYAPSSEQIVHIQKLVPRFPEIVLVIRNILRIVYFVGRKGIFIEIDSLYQIAKELAIAFHSISPYVWKSMIDLEVQYNEIDEYSGDLNKKMKNIPFIPIYEEAYWRISERELLLNTCAAVLTSREIMTFPTAVITCHFGFLRIPLSKKISITIPEEVDLEENEMLMSETVAFFLKDFVSDPMKFVKSKEYNKDPMLAFINTFLELPDQITADLDIESRLWSFSSSSSLQNLFIRYDYFLNLFDNGHGSDNTEANYNLIHSQINGVKNMGFSDYKYFGVKSKHDFAEYIPGRFPKGNSKPQERYSKFWGYKPRIYIKNLKISTNGSNLDQLFESFSILLYGTVSNKNLIEDTYKSVLILMNKICELEREVIESSKNKNSRINIQGVEEAFVSFVFTRCEEKRNSLEKTEFNLKKNRQPNEHDRMEYNIGINHLEIFETIQFIYKTPILLFEMDLEESFIKDTELNKKLYEKKNINALATAIRIAKVFTGSSRESFRYMPLIPKVTVEDFQELKNGVGPIPLKAIIRAMESIPKSLYKREKFKFRRRTAFDDATNNFTKNKQAPILFPRENNSKESSLVDDLVPIIRRYIPFVPGDVEGKNLLQFIKIATAVIDLKRRPIKELPDMNMEKTFKSILLDNSELSGSKQHLMKIYGLNVDEVVEKNKLYDENLFENTRTGINSIGIYPNKYLEDFTANKYYIDNSYKFILDYFNSVRHTNISPTVIYSFIDRDKLEKIAKPSRKPGIGEMIRDMVAYSAISVFSEFYYYWTELKLKMKEFFWNNNIDIGFYYSKSNRERLEKKKQISMYIKDELDKIKIRE
ncbi:large secreted protein, signal peptide [Cryptosporidium felis]|nr:large secreted protein, signal peptide [Cryptosporidium felis]